MRAVPRKFPAEGHGTALPCVGFEHSVPACQLIKAEKCGDSGEGQLGGVVLVGRSKIRRWVQGNSHSVKLLVDRPEELRESLRADQSIAMIPRRVFRTGGFSVSGIGDQLIKGQAIDQSASTDFVGPDLTLP